MYLLSQQFYCQDFYSYICTCAQTYIYKDMHYSIIFQPKYHGVGEGLNK